MSEIETVDGNEFKAEQKDESNLDPEIYWLRREVANLRQENQALREKLDALPELSSSDQGLTAERFVAGILRGGLTEKTNEIDIRLEDRTRIEVKYANLNSPVKQSSTKRWVWRHVFGESGRKRYDFLILLGERDDRYSKYYKEKISDYVIFCIPFERINEFATKSKEGQIFLTTNPHIVRKNRSRTIRLFTDFQVDSMDLAAKFGDSSHALPIQSVSS
jgi:hypothetical protein